MSQLESSELMQLRVHGVVTDPNTDTQIVVLRGEQDHDFLPIWVGIAEGNSIRLALAGTPTPRPMSHDLIQSIADYLGVKLTHVAITDVKNNTYYATIYFTLEGTERHVDSRPSDAIALALRTNRPIYVSREVLRQRSGGNLDDWQEKLGVKNLEQ